MTIISCALPRNLEGVLSRNFINGRSSKVLKRMWEEMKKRPKHWALRFIGIWIATYILWFILDLMVVSIFKLPSSNDLGFMTWIVLIISAVDLRACVVK